mgnify:CR=1 FL=1
MVRLGLGFHPSDALEWIHQSVAGSLGRAGMAPYAGDFRIRRMLADLLARQHRTNSAILVLQEGVQLTPEVVELRLQLAQTLMPRS